MSIYGIHESCLLSMTCTSHVSYLWHARVMSLIVFLGRHTSYESCLLYIHIHKSVMYLDVHMHMSRSTRAAVQRVVTWLRGANCQKKPMICQKRPIMCQKRPIVCQKRPMVCQNRPIMVYLRCFSACRNLAARSSRSSFACSSLFVCAYVYVYTHVCMCKFIHLWHTWVMSLSVCMCKFIHVSSFFLNLAPCFAAELIWQRDVYTAKSMRISIRSPSQGPCHGLGRWL